MADKMAHLMVALKVQRWEYCLAGTKALSTVSSSVALLDSSTDSEKENQLVSLMENQLACLLVAPKEFIVDIIP